jgi:hypothetical protein
MRLEAGPVPTETIDAVRRSLSGRLPSKGVPPWEVGRDFDVDLDDLRGVQAFPPPNEASISLPHYVYSLGMDATDRDDPLSAAEPTMVRFLVNDGLRFSASAEIPLSAMQDEDPVPDISSGVSAGEMADLIRRVEGADLSGDTFEVRLLRVPALQMTALWLHDVNLDALDRFWLLGEGREPSPEDGLDRTSMTSELRARAHDWAESYRTVLEADDDPSLLGG